MTTGPKTGSSFLRILASLLISAGCGAASEPDPAPWAAHGAPPRAASAPPAAAPTPAAAPDPPPDPPPPPPETSLGVADRGIWSDLDGRIQLRLPARLTAERVAARVDERRALLVLSIDGFPRKVYPLGGPATLQVGPHALALRPGDRAELAGLLAPERITVAPAEPPAARAPSAAGARRPRDADGDGIPDPLDVLIGAKKTVQNADAYTEGYMQMKFPMGDVPREVGVCTDVVIRAVRNAGVDLQQALFNDILRARAAYPMIVGRPDPQIDQRRVATLLPYFRRHWQAHTTSLDDPADPLRPGDVLFMDTFPSRSGPDHIGIVSDTIGPEGLPLVINNWTNGTVTAEMDLLTFVPVMYRFRLPE